MYRKKAGICLFLTLLMLFILPASVHAAITPLAAPTGATASVEGTQFIIKWQNPSDITKFAKEAYDNYTGLVFYTVDWRVNNGEWHYDGEVPGDQGFFNYYRNMHLQFFGRLIDESGSVTKPDTIVDKLFVGVPYNTPIKEWLKNNNVEFRIRYIYEYWDENLQQGANQCSAFSNTVLLGTSNPTGSKEPMPQMGEYGNALPPSTIGAPQNLESEYMTLNLRWKVPEDVRTLNDMNTFPVFPVIDWKLNKGQWNDGLKGIRDINYPALSWNNVGLPIDKNGYTNIELHRGSLKITPGCPLSAWLADKTYYFKVRYVMWIPEENQLKEVISPYSNTVTLGRGTTPPQKSVKKR